MKLRNCFIASVMWMVTMAAPVFGASITSFSPAYSKPDGATFITINGSGFLGGTLYVRFNGVLAASAYVSTQDGSQIQARIAPNTPAGSGPITVQIGTGPLAYSPENFAVVGTGPYIHSFTPTNGSDNTLVSIVGMNLAGVTNVTFGTRNAVGTLPPSSDTLMSLRAPAGVITGSIIARSSKGVYSTSPRYFYVPPVITSTSITNGRAGTNFVIRGTNFVGTSAVLLNGPGGAYTLPASFTVWSNTAVQVTVPEGARTGKVRLEAPAGPSLTPTNFVIQPLITGFSPNAGGVGTAVLISGANLNVGSTVVRFNGVQAVTNGVSFGQLTAYVPPGASTGPISVQTADGSYTTLPRFYLPPTVTGFSPSNSAPGTRVTITGQNLLDAISVSFDALPAASFVVSNNTTIGAVVPEGVSSGPLRIITPGGLANSAGNFFAPPFIDSFLPLGGLPGTVVTLTGSNFLGATAVRFNGLNAANFAVVNNFTIQATVPANAQTGPITVVAPAGTNTTATSFTLDYLSDIAVSLTDAPDPVNVTSNLVYTMNIGNNGPYAAKDVKVTNTLPASVAFVSATPSHGTVEVFGNQVVNTITNLNFGVWASLNVAVKPQTPGNIDAIVTGTSYYPDPNPANNTATTTTTVLPLALLKIQMLNNSGIRVSWPAILDDYTLEYQSPLVETGAWSTVTSPVFVVGDERRVTETNNGTFKFYRLMK